MKCFKCGKDYTERLLHDSHDVPCYLFPGVTRQEKRKHADKYGRHWLCSGEETNDCHKFYEQYLKNIFIEKAQEIAKVYFKKEDVKDDNKN